MATTCFKHTWINYADKRVCQICRKREPFINLREQFYEKYKIDQWEQDTMDDAMFKVLTGDKMEKDPNGINDHENGCKKDKGKPDASLLGMFGKALLAVAEVGTYGAEKYTRGGWESVSDGINRYTAAMLRHYLTERYEDYDTDLPVLHAAQCAWNSLARLELILREKDEKVS